MPWYDFAACLGMDTEDFFPVSEQATAQIAEARAVCRRCPVASDCLTDALEGRPYGIAGGMTEGERDALQRTNRAA